MADTPKHSVSVAGIVVDDQGRVLVIQRRDNGHWEPPGGVLELGETPQEGVRREVFEETGIEVSVGGLTGVYKNLERSVVALVFACSPQTHCVAKSTSESFRVKWMDQSQVEAAMTEAYAVRISDALNGHVAVRSHDGVALARQEASSWSI